MTPDRALAASTRLLANIERALRGKTEVVQRAVIALIARGHLLLEDVPGVGKTTLAHALARSIDASFRHIQFTSDLLPADLLGASTPDMHNGRPTGSFAFQRGPIFANVVVCDEINRSGPKAQSALLEAMSEASVTVDGIRHDLPNPFFVVATQNPLEHHGTHPLPESQLDRFTIRRAIGYPTIADEAIVLREDPATTELPQLRAVVTIDEILGMQRAADRVKFDDSLIDYLLAIVTETREHEALELGISPRGAVALRRAAQARAITEGRDFCIPEDVRDLAVDVFAHRVSVDARSRHSRDGEESQWIIRDILDHVPVPL